MQFLVDVNLPRNFSYSNDSQFVHVVDINPRMSDKDIWQFALENGLVILTKDTDFYHKLILYKDLETPKVVYFKIGNRTLKEMHQYFSMYWNTILSKLPQTRLIIAHSTQIELIN